MYYVYLNEPDSPEWLICKILPVNFSKMLAYNANGKYGNNINGKYLTQMKRINNKL
jgi:hypothetical protein